MGSPQTMGVDQGGIFPAILRVASITPHEKTVDVLLVNPEDPVEHVLISRRNEKAAGLLQAMELNADLALATRLEA